MYVCCPIPHPASDAPQVSTAEAMAQDTRAGQWLGEYLQLGMQNVLSVLRIIPPTLLTDGLQQLIEQLQVSGCGGWDGRWLPCVNTRYRILTSPPHRQSEISSLSPEHFEGFWEAKKDGDGGDGGAGGGGAGGVSQPVVVE